MITFGTPSGSFTYRVAGVAIIDGHALIHRNPEDDFWALPGGRVEMMEPAHDALQREMLEETGLKATVGRLIWIVENFFQTSWQRSSETFQPRRNGSSGRTVEPGLAQARQY